MTKHSPFSYLKLGLGLLHHLALAHEPETKSHRPWTVEQPPTCLWCCLGSICVEWFCLDRCPWTKPRMRSHHPEPVIHANLIISKQARKSDVNASGALSSADTCTCAKKPSANALLSLLRKSPTSYLQDDLPICPTLTPA